ncbi:MAG: hypothetical protein J0G32_06520 [Alphaproteobacteria bacterium]|nr:hypothetical protein [Alphaproteobacteria bacterium]OJV12078.1 MAG: hypothetical protein BGO27_04980 [Alphaproteobacteria bacterium 33-17]
MTKVKYTDLTVKQKTIADSVLKNVKIKSYVYSDPDDRPLFINAALIGLIVLRFVAGAALTWFLMPKFVTALSRIVPLDKLTKMFAPIANSNALKPVAQFFSKHSAKIVKGSVAYVGGSIYAKANYIFTDPHDLVVSLGKKLPKFIVYTIGILILPIRASVEKARVSNAYKNGKKILLDDDLNCDIELESYINNQLENKSESFVGHVLNPVTLYRIDKRIELSEKGHDEIKAAMR